MKILEKGGRGWKGKGKGKDCKDGKEGKDGKDGKGHPWMNQGGKPADLQKGKGPAEPEPDRPLTTQVRNLLAS